MNSRKKHESWRPTPPQELLLTSALFPEKEAIKAWHQWTEKADIDNLDPSSSRLLPLVYKNLQNSPVDEALRTRLKSVYRKTWYRNNIYFSQLDGLVSSFQNNGIQTMLLKGMALTISYYEDFGLRPMEDFDILIPREKTKTAIELMQLNGWRIKDVYKCPINDAFMVVMSGLHFENDLGCQCDLNWNLFKDISLEAGDSDFWENGIQIPLKNVKTLGLRPEDLLLHICKHGSRGERGNIRWIPDVLIILNKKRDTLDWDRILNTAQKYWTTLIMREMFSYLNQFFPSILPLHFLSKLQSSRISLNELKYYETTSRKKEISKVFYRLYWLFRRHKTNSGKGNSSFSSIINFPRYLQVYCNTEHLWLVPFLLVSRSLNKIWKGFFH